MKNNTIELQEFLEISKFKLEQANLDLVTNTQTQLKQGDSQLNPDINIPDPLKPAAVLIPIIETGSSLSVILTQRTEKMSAHPGQISFPGGKVEKNDTDATYTALRETKEEIGIDAQYINILGTLDEYQTSTGFLITPIVSYVKPGYVISTNPHEVSEVFEVPLNFLMSPDNHQKKSIMWQGKKRYFYTMPYENRYIWGATAGIIRNLYERLYN